MLNWAPSTNNKDVDGSRSGLSLISTRKVAFSGAILVFLACLALAATTCFSPIWNFSPKSYWRPAKGDASVEYTNQLQRSVFSHRIRLFTGLVIMVPVSVMVAGPE